MNLDENRTLNESLSNYFNGKIEKTSNIRQIIFSQNIDVRFFSTDSAAIDVEQMLDDQIKTISKALEENEITNILDNNHVTEK